MALHREYMIANTIHTVRALLCRCQQLSTFRQLNYLILMRHDQLKAIQLVVAHEPLGLDYFTFMDTDTPAYVCAERFAPQGLCD